MLPRNSVKVNQLRLACPGRGVAKQGKPSGEPAVTSRLGRKEDNLCTLFDKFCQYTMHYLDNITRLG